MIGIDAVDVERFRAVMARAGGTEQRLFTAREQSYCRGHTDPVLHYAGTLAAKEAVIKAAGLGPLVAWSRRIEVRRDPSGAPCATVSGSLRRRFAVSISHDGPIAVAIAMARGHDPEPVDKSEPEHDQEELALRPNERLLRYIRGGGVQARTGWDLGDASWSVQGTDFP